MKVGSNINVVDGTISLTKNNVVNALGYTPLKSGGSSVTLENSTGSSTTSGMTQAATAAALANKLDATASAASASKVIGGTITLSGPVTKWTN